MFKLKAKKRASPRNQLILLIINGYNSYITSKLIIAYISRSINLLIILPHCSYMLQPLNIGVFSPLKRFYSLEVN